MVTFQPDVVADDFWNIHIDDTMFTIKTNLFTFSRSVTSCTECLDPLDTVPVVESVRLHLQRRWSVVVRLHASGNSPYLTEI